MSSKRSRTVKSKAVTAPASSATDAKTALSDGAPKTVVSAASPAVAAAVAAAVVNATNAVVSATPVVAPTASVPATAAAVAAPVAAEVTKLRDDILAGSTEVHILASEKEIDTFFEFPAAFKFLICYAEWCGPCKQFTPLYAKLAPPRGFTPIDAKTNKATPEDQDVIFAAIESKHVEIIKKRIANFPFAGFPTTVILEGKGNPPKVAHSVVRGALPNASQEAIIYAQLEALRPGILSSPAMSYVDVATRTAAITQSKLPNVGLPPSGTGGGAGGGCNNPNCNNPNCPNYKNKAAAGGSPATSGAMAVFPTQPPPPKHLAAVPTAEVLSSSTSDGASTLNESKTVRTHWYHMTHPLQTHTQMSATAYQLVNRMRQEFQMPWDEVVHPSVAQTPTIMVVNRDERTGVGHTVQLTGAEAVDALGTLVRSFDAGK